MFYSRKRRLKTTILAMMGVLMLTHLGSAQTTVTQTECFCLGNATTPTNGQYRDTVIITSGIPGQTWRLQNAIGFYNPQSLAPPASPITYFNNSIISEFQPGKYRIIGKRVSGQSWSFLATNSATGQILPVSSKRVCAYPTTAQMTITGDADACPGSGETYSIPSNPNLSGISWTVTGGTIVSATNGNSVNVVWGSNPGTYSINVVATLRSFAGQSKPCPLTASKNVTITDLQSSTRIKGDFGNCIGAQEEYELSSRNFFRNVVWSVTLDSLGTLPSGIVTTPKVGDAFVRIIQWPNTAGTYFIRVTGEYRPTNTSANWCRFTSVQRVVIANEPTTSLSCNGHVNLSMNPNCELNFSPGQFLTYLPYPASSYDIIIRDVEENKIIPNGTVGLNYVGKTLEVKVVHECSGNVCWGYAKIEDKSIPDLECPEDIEIECEDVSNLSVTGMPNFPAGVVVTPVNGMPNKFIVDNFDRCSALTLEYKDVVQSKICVGPYSSIITRTWTITDDHGNKSSCVQIINVLKASLEDVEFPGNWDTSTGPNPTLEACGNYPLIPIDSQFPNHPNGGNPSPEFTGYPSGTLCLNASVSFLDSKIAICGSHSYKIVRKWRIVDHCANPVRVITDNQLITIMDTEAPVVACRDNLDRIGANLHACGGDLIVPAPEVVKECGKFTWAVDFLEPGTTDNFIKELGKTKVVVNDSRVRIENLPFGNNTIRYIVTDECGNFTYCYTDVEVVDDVKPTPVCDRNSVIAIGSEGFSLVGVSTFDGGSHDNCQLDCIKVRRMDTGTPISFDLLEKNNLTRFTCEDVGKMVMVEMRVYDESGNFNSCMTEVRVQDNIPPVINAPASRSIPCTSDLSDLTKYGVATATDNCNVRVTEGNPVRNLSDCGVGTILRTFVATDNDGNSVSAQQVITVTNTQVFDRTDIDWPDTYNAPSVPGNCENKSRPEDLPAAFARPRFLRDTSCSQLLVTYDDVVFHFQDGVCTKILRTWTVIDHCQKSIQNPNAGVFKETQLLMFRNATRPEITFGCRPEHLTITPAIDACGAKVKVTARGKDDCTDSLDLVWSYTIDEGNNNSLEVSNGTGRSIDRQFPAGEHKITWFVTDGCKNTFSCSNIFRISDTKKPTPVCVEEIVTVVMPSTKSINIWASDFNLGSSYDNCTPANKLVASFSPTNRNDISRTYTCDSLGNQASKDFILKVYLIDEAGNSDFCTVRLRIQANGNTCDPNTPKSLSIRGNIYSEGSKEIQDVDVLLQTNHPEFPKNSMTSQDGLFAFDDLPMYQDYDLIPNKNDDHLNGVSTLDLVLIQRHILGLSKLSSPYKLIAADVNNSEKVTASDLVDLRKTILGIHKEFPNNRSWRFVDVSHTFSDANNPWPFAERAYMSTLDHDVAGLDFVGVKVGDVNESANTAKLSGRSASSIKTDKTTAQEKEVFDVVLKTDEISNVVGMQYSFAFDPALVELVDITSTKIDLKPENIGLTMIDKGVIALSWNSSDPYSLGGDVLKFTFKAKKNIDNQEILQLLKDGLGAEIYTLTSDNSIHTTSTILTYNRTFDKEQFELFQNIPNPFNSTTQIGFNLPKADKVHLKVFDLSGKMLYHTSGDFTKGYNVISLDINDMVSNGVLYYQIESGSHSAKRKMIVIK
jgi:hypothetical protein